MDKEKSKLEKTIKSIVEYANMLESTYNQYSDYEKTDKALWFIRLSDLTYDIEKNSKTCYSQLAKLERKVIP